MLRYVNENFKNWTNLCLAVPLGLAFYYDLHVYSFAIALAMLSSFMYHSSNSIKLKYFDLVAACLLIVLNFYYLFSGGISYRTLPFFTLALFFAGCGLYFKFVKVTTAKQHSLNHGYWHIMSSFVTIFCICTYVLAFAY